MYVYCHETMFPTSRFFCVCYCLNNYFVVYIPAVIEYLYTVYFLSQLSLSIYHYKTAFTQHLYMSDDFWNISVTQRAKSHTKYAKLNVYKTLLSKHYTQQSDTEHSCASLRHCPSQCKTKEDIGCDVRLQVVGR